LSVVVEMANAAYWTKYGAESREAVDQFCRMARKHPEVEILFVTDSAISVGDTDLPNVRSVASPDPTYFGMKRLGMLQARSGVVAFADSDCLYPQDYVEQLLAAFADPKVQIVGGRTRYPIHSARTKAANIRDWGHLPEQGPAPQCLVANNLAARKQVLEKYQFGLGFQRVAGELMFCFLAQMDGIAIRYLPSLLARHHDFRDALGPSWYKALMDYPASVDLARRALTRLKVSGWRRAAFLQLMPLHIWWMMTRASARWYRPMRGELDIRGFQRLTVPLWLAVFYVQSGWLALRGFLQPGWLLRRGRELGFTLSPELDDDANHPLNLAIDRTIAWVRQDRSRIDSLFMPGPAVEEALTPPETRASTRIAG
jgi:hypothetical protein